MLSWIEAQLHYYVNEILIPRLEFEWPYLLTVFGLLILELFIIGWKESSLRSAIQPAKTNRWDLFSLAIQITGIRRILSHLFLLGLLAGLMGSVGSYSFNWTAHWPVVLRYVAAFFCFDFLQYWFHRIRHENGWVWTVHEFHHSATTVNLLTSFRVHPLDYLFYLLLLSIPFQLIFGMDVPDSILFSMVVSLPGYYSHSRWDTNFGWLGRYFLVSPRFHQLHHSVHAEKFKNYGHALVIWDRLFGTYVEDSRRISELEQGIAKNIYETSSPWAAFVDPVRRFYFIPAKSLGKVSRRIFSSDKSSTEPGKKAG